MWPFDEFSDVKWDAKSMVLGWLSGFIFALVIFLIYLTYQENFGGKFYNDAEKERVLYQQRAKPLHIIDGKIVDCSCGCPNCDLSQGTPKSKNKGQDFDEVMGVQDENTNDISNIDEPKSGVEPSGKEVVDNLVTNELHGDV